VYACGPRSAREKIVPPSFPHFFPQKGVAPVCAFFSRSMSLFPTRQAKLARWVDEADYCGGLVVLGRVVRGAVVLGRGVAGAAPVVGCAGTPDLAL
jgi:hypothetical protein